MKYENPKKQKFLEELRDKITTDLWTIEIKERVLQRLNIANSNKYTNELGETQRAIIEMKQFLEVIEDELGG